MKGWMMSRTQSRGGSNHWDPSSKAVWGLLQRKCACGQHSGGAQCDDCKTKHSTLQRQAASASTQPAVPGIVHDVLRSSGQPLEASTRGLMESRFRHDFSHVRVHSDSQAAESARAVNAHAYTVGNHVVFERGNYAPRTSAGSQLLAHELTHVMQQGIASGSGDEIKIAPEDDSAEREAERNSRLAGDTPDGSVVAQRLPLLQRQTKPGTAFYQEIVGPTSSPAPGVKEGTVERQEIDDKGKVISDAFTTGIRFDENTCKVTIPVRVSYREPAGTDLTQYIEKGEKAAALPKEKGKEVFRRYISEVNEKLNGWFGVRLLNCDGAKCADKTIPIDVEVREDDSNPDYTVTAVNAKGRSYVSQRHSASDVGHVVLIGKGGLDQPYTMAHEGAHMALAADDEYKEEGRPTERVHEDDFSLLTDQNSYRGWSLLHQRHFAFVPAFLKSFVKSGAGKPCEATLQEQRKPSSIDIRITAAEEYTSFGGGGLYVGGGVSFGYSPGLRGTRLELGPHFGYSIGDYKHRPAYLLGLRVGAEKRFTPSSGGVRLGTYLEGGRITYGTSDQPPKSSAYLEGGATVGYGFSPVHGTIISLFVDAAAGTTIDPHDPQNQKWFRLGLGAGWEF